MRTLIRLCLLIVAAFICSIIFSTPQRAFAQANCTVCISEFRTRGPGDLSNTAGSTNDEFIEIYNNTDAPIVITGYKLRTADSAGNPAATRATIGTVTLPARGHYLFGNTNSSAGGNYASSLGAVAVADQGYGTGINDANGIAITDPSDVVLDAVGMSAGTILKEGTSLPPQSAGTAGASQQFSYVRKVDLVTNHPIDTGNNATDFVQVVADTVANLTTKYTGQTLTLGAPGPENMTSALESTSKFTTALYDITKTAAQAPNRCYDPAATGGTVGALYIRRNITNNTAPTTQLLFRVVDITTATFPAPAPALAIIKPMTVDPLTDVTACTRLILPIQGTTLPSPPNVAANGGLNSALSTTPIAATSNANVEYKLAADKTGTFRFLLIYEAK